MTKNEIFQARRERFMKEMGSGVAILPSSPVRVRSNDTDYRYRPDSDLFYLTGFAEPEAVAVVAPDHKEHKLVLFVRPRDPEREIWDGRRAGVDGAIADFGADAAYPISELDEKLPEYVDGASRLHYRFGRDEEFDRRIVRVLNSYSTSRRAKGPGPSTIVDPGEIVHEMRLYKTPDEVEIMRRAAAITAEAHRAAMAEARPGIFEYELEATIEYTFRRNGASGPSYASIVGSGPNATILHYIENSRRVEDGDLVLVDAGAEYDYYAADVTRTWPVSGRFTAEQRAIYELVLESQVEAIEASRPGVTMHEIHEGVVRTIAAGLVRLGLLEGPAEKAIEAGTYKKFFMHKTGHYLGMDVHDVGRYRDGDQWRKLAPGMVQTVEPGIYIAADCEDVEPRWRGIGVRIEDDVLITESGHEVLTKDAPKAVDEIERIVGSAAAAGVSSL
jgi:Xaa-Pro aminopeptidase